MSKIFSDEECVYERGKMDFGSHRVGGRQSGVGKKNPGERRDIDVMIRHVSERVHIFSG